MRERERDDDDDDDGSDDDVILKLFRFTATLRIEKKNKNCIPLNSIFSNAHA